MEYTQNYALRKPGLNEYANVGDLNYNSDKIDSQMKKNQDVDGEVYDPTSTSANAYEAGDYVINPDDGLMYVCNGTTYGTWDATKWDHTTEFEEIQKAMASGGESELADLHDVDITNPTEGQVLTYDEQNDEWVNSDLPDADVTKEASGNPIDFSDGADAPLVKCTTAIQGNQDLHGYDKPWVGGSGKNKIPLTLDVLKTLNSYGTWNGNVFTHSLGATITVNVDNGGNVTSIKASGTPSGNVFFILADITVSGSYVLNGCPSDGSSSTYELCIVNNTLDQFIARDFGSGGSFTCNEECVFRLVIRSGYTANNLTFYPMVRLATVSDSTFAPYSNICPITAYTKGEIEVRGKNALDPLKVKTGFQYNPSVGTQFTLTDIADMTDNGGGTFSKTISGWYCFGYLFELPESECSFKIQYSGTGARVSYGFLDDSYTVLSSEYNSNTNQTITKSLAKTGTRKYFFFTATTNQTTADITFTEPQIEFGSTATTYSPYTSTTHTTTYPSAIYRGSEDVVNGSVYADWGVVDLGDLTWSPSGSAGRFYARFSNDDNVKPSPSSSVKGNYICENYNAGSQSDIADRGIDGTVSLDSNVPPFINILDTSCAGMTGADFKTHITGVLFAYELATPTTTPVTPTNLPIKSLSGYNHIESSTGEMEIEYFPAKEQPLIDLIPEASNMHTYSTAEHAVGTWIDGETIYERSIDLGSFSIGSGGTYIIEEATDIDLLIDYDGYVIESSIMYALPDPSIRIKMESNKDLIFSGTANWDVTSGYLTIRYTKTSSNNRSLAKSAPQEETKEEQVEELKEEPTEETKEEPVEEVKEEETKEEGEVNER